MILHLSKREINILLLLLELEGSITTKELAETFQVSVRTVKYDLENVRQWLEEQEATLHARRNKGIWLDISASKRTALKNEILGVERFEAYPDQEVRVNKLVFYLLFSQGYVTAQQLADALQVSRNTIMTDLDRGEQLIQSYGLSLHRQSRQGFLIEGSESSIRLLLEYLAQKEMTEYDIYQIMSRLIQPEQSENVYEMPIGMHGIQTLFQQVYQISVEEMASLLDPSLLDQFNYAEILSITLRVAIAAARMQLHHTIGSYTLVTNQQTLLEKEELPFLLMKQVFERYALPLLSDEYLYIYSDVFVSGNQQDIARLTDQLIQDVSEEMQISFYRDHQLFTNLFAHLSLRLTKRHQFINEYNPFVDDIKARYPQLFAAIAKVSKKKLSSSLLLINDSFVAYIALHFLVAYEKNLQEVEDVRVVYVCSTGLGVTSLIEQKIMEEVTNVTIVGFASVLNATEFIEAKQPDLVLSIFPIESSKRPFIKVNPLPTKADIQNIQEEVNKILSHTRGSKPSHLASKKRTESFKSVEERSHDILLQAYIVYEELLKAFGDQLQTEYKEAFLLHVMLMTHRILFDGQYENNGNIIKEKLFAQQSLVEQIENIFAQNELAVNQAEITALLNYLKEE